MSKIRNYPFNVFENTTSQCGHSIAVTFYAMSLLSKHEGKANFVYQNVRFLVLEMPNVTKDVDIL